VNAAASKNPKNLGRINVNLAPDLPAEHTAFSANFL
jgi:hypothetical protein